MSWEEVENDLAPRWKVGRELTESFQPKDGLGLARPGEIRWCKDLMEKKEASQSYGQSKTSRKKVTVGRPRGVVRGEG